MADLATLGLAVDSSQVKTATAELDKLSGASKRAEQSAGAIEASAKRAGVSVDEYRARMAGAGQATQSFASGVGIAGQNAAKAADQIGLARHELINLSRQAQDVGVSLASGQSPFTVLVQQGAQIGDIFASTQGTVGGFFGQVTSAAGAILTPMRLLTAGVAGAAVGIVSLAYSYQQGEREIKRSLMGIGGASGATVADIKRFGDDSAAAFGLSVTQGRAAAVAFAGTGRIYGDTIGLARSSVANFAIVAGVDATEATKTLAKALADPVAGADQLNAVLGHLDGKTREYIQTLVNTGQRQAAQRVLMQATIDATKNATDALGPLEKAWIVVGNAAARALQESKETANFVLTLGAQNTPQANLGRKQDQLAGAMQFRDQVPMDNPEWEKRNKLVRQLSDEMVTLAKRLDDVNNKRLNQISTDADDAVKAIIPEIQQVDKLTEAWQKLQLAQSTPGAAGKMGMSAEVQAATDAYRVQIGLLEEAKQGAAQYNAEILRLVDLYGGVTIQTAAAFKGQEGQLAVAQAIGGAARMEAQEQATIANLILARVPPEEAIARAANDRAIAQAQVNSGAREQLLSLQDQVAVAGAISAEERISAQYVAERNKLIREGVNPALAEQVAQMQAAVAQAAEMANQARQYAAEQERIEQRQHENFMRNQAKQEEAVARSREAERRFWNEWFAAHDAMGGYAGFAYGGQSQFKKEGYQSTVANIVTEMAKRQYGEGGFDQSIGIGSASDPIEKLTRITPNQKGLENVVDRMLSGGKSLLDAINSITSGGLGRDPLHPNELSGAQTSLISKLTDLLPKEGQKSAIEKELEQIKKQPVTLAREQLIKDLTDKLEQLSTSVDGMTASLDPLFAQGHGALPQIGYYHAATGLSGVVSGSGGTDSTPVRIMATPGEPIRVGKGANDNGGGNTYINQTINFPKDAVGERRRSYRQMAEGFHRGIAAGG